MATEIWVNIGSGNGLLPDGTKPLPEPVLTDHQWSPVTFILGQFYNRSQILQPITEIHLKITYPKFHSNFSGVNELMNTLRPEQNADILQITFSKSISFENY